MCQTQAILCDIAPMRELRIGNNSEPRTVICSASCSDGNTDLETVLFRNSLGHDILSDHALESILSHMKENMSGNCIYTLSIRWTKDGDLRNRLDTVQCVFIYGNHTCLTDAINITFSGMYAWL